MYIPGFNPLPMTRKEELGNDLRVLADFIEASHEHIKEELIIMAKEEIKRIYKLYEEEK